MEHFNRQESSYGKVDLKFSLWASAQFYPDTLQYKDFLSSNSKRNYAEILSSHPRMELSDSDKDVQVQSIGIYRQVAHYNIIGTVR